MAIIQGFLQIFWHKSQGKKKKNESSKKDNEIIFSLRVGIFATNIKGETAEIKIVKKNYDWTVSVS